MATSLAASCFGLPIFTQSTTRDSDDIVVEGARDEIVLGGITGGDRARVWRGTSGVGGRDGISRGSRDDAYVGQLTVVGAAHRVDGEEVQRVRVQVVTRLERDDRGVVPRVDEREVIRTHLVDTLGVLIDQRRVGDRVNTGVVVDNTKHGVVDRDAVGRAEREFLVGGVVRPRRLDGLVAASPEESLDRVRKANVDRAGRVRVEVLYWGSLYLLDEDITRGASHLLTFIVGYDGVVGPYVDVRHDLVGVRVEEIRRGNSARRPSTVTSGAVRVNDHQFGEIAESKVDAHFVIRESSGRESDTRVTRVEERQREVERGGRENLLASSVYVQRATVDVLGWGRESNGAWVRESRDVTDHVVVTGALASRHSEGRPEIEVIVIETSSNEIVKGDSAL